MNMLIALISDTHITAKRGKLPDAVFEKFNGVDLILHAGDISVEEVLEDLAKIAPVIAVSGNNDKLDLRKTEIIDACGKKILLVHGDKIDNLYDFGLENGADIVVSGHTHTPHFEKRNGMILINPGSSNRPVNSKASIAILKIGDDVDVEFIRM